jgi:glycosyltransferase involved in cell wall biosynthesis
MASAGEALVGAGQQVVPRRVLIIVENLPAPFDRRVWQEARSLVGAGYEVSIICPKMKGYSSSYEMLEGVHIHRHPLPHEGSGPIGFAFEYAVALTCEFLLAWRVLLTRGFDVIHACNPPDLIFLIGLFFKVFFGKRFVFDHHDVCPELYEAKFTDRGVFHRLLRLLERWSFRTADVSIATNESYRKVAIERGGMDPDKVFVVRSGPDLERIRILPPVERLKRGRRHLVGYVGVMGRQEGIHYLLEAVRHIVSKLGRKDIHFGLVGGGTELEAMKRFARELGVDDFVTFTGRVPDREMLEMLNTADVCVNPDEFNEMNDKSTMNKIMEYMALGKPIVQFDMTEGRFSAGEASLYAHPNDPVDLGNKLVELVDDPARREEMGRIGRERVERELAWPHEAPKLLAAYRALWSDA